MNVFSKKLLYLSLVFIAFFSGTPIVSAKEIGYIPSEQNASGQAPGGGHFRFVLNPNERFKRFAVRHGKRIDGFQFFVDRPGLQGRWYPLAGGTGGSEDSWIISTRECLVRVSGTYDVSHKSPRPRIFSLQFHLHNGVSSRLFGKNGKHNFVLSAPNGEEIVGFFGKEGAELDAIGIVTAPSACN